jgi:epoxide hydrolase-like predicted phosphatase
MGPRRRRAPRLNWKVIKAVVFDLGQVIIPFDWQRGYRALAGFSPYPLEEVRSRIKETGLFSPFERGQIEPQSVAREISRVLDLDVSFEKFRELWSSIFLPETTVSEDMLSRLRAAGQRVLLLSNTDAIHFEWIIERYPIMRQFDRCVLSFEVGFRKPEPEIYKEAIVQARCQPEEIFFTDDIAENVEGARRLGIDAVRFQSLPQLEQELRSRGVAW